MYVLVWVDDMFIVGAWSFVDQVQNAVSRAFKADDLVEPTWLLGMDIRRDPGESTGAFSLVSTQFDSDHVG